MKKFSPISPSFPHLLHGGDYNPEQWPADVWEEDMALMKEANCNEMTVGIFSWAEIEKEEGVFDFSFLDTILDKIYKNGGRAVLATPSGARPRWLAEKYPEVLRVNDTMHKNGFSSRHNHCYTSPIYRKKVRIINEKLAERYGHHPAVVAWHLSNEYGGTCYCDLCRAAFQDFLRKKFDNDIEKLNQAYWTRFWSHRFDRFDQIDPPRKTPGGDSCILGLNLAWMEFVSHQTVEFARLEAEALRRYSDYPITTNCMPRFAGYDHWEMAKVLDVHAVDLYPRWGGRFDAVGAYVAYHSAVCRSMQKGRPFMVMESAPGINIGNVSFHKVKTDEEQHFEAVSFLAGGADTVQYFQWRKGRGAAEKFHGAVVDHYGKSDTRVFQMVKNTGALLKKLDALVGCGIDARVAILQDYKSIWALDNTLCGITKDGNGYQALQETMFGSLWRKNIACDIVSYESDLSRYSVVITPMPYLMSETEGDILRRYVEGGGCLISTCLTAVADENDLNYLGGTPGAHLRKVFGLRVDEIDYYAVGANAPNGVLYGGANYPVARHAELVIPEGAEVLARFESDILKDQPAVLANRFGKGSAYYLAFYPDAAFLDAFLPAVLAKHGVTPEDAITGDASLRVSHREGDDDHFYFLFNAASTPASAVLHFPLTDVESGQTLEGPLMLEGAACRIFKK